MVLLLVFMQLTRDLFAIAKFLFFYAEALDVCNNLAKVTSLLLRCGITTEIRTCCPPL